MVPCITIAHVFPSSDFRDLSATGVTADRDDMRHQELLVLHQDIRTLRRFSFVIYDNSECSDRSTLSSQSRV